MAAAIVVSLFGIGLAVGLLSGMVGIGGGVLMVPLLYLYYATPGWSGAAVDPGMHAAMAHATSLFVIVPTALLGTIKYHRSGVVAWRAALPMAAGSIAAAVGGARVALLLPDQWLKAGFGIFLIATGVNLLVRRSGADGAPPRLGGPLLLAAGAATGFFSALLGVGGGLVAIPLLIYATRLPLERVAATSLAVVMFAATAGALTYVVIGADVTGLPASSVGYVDVGAGLPLLIGALCTVQAGARLNQKMATASLRRLFAAVLLVLGFQIFLANAFGLA